MKRIGFLLVLAASLAFAADTPRVPHPVPQRAKIACSDALRPQMEADTLVAAQRESTAHAAGFQQGAALGAGCALLLAGLAFSFKKPQGGNVPQKPLTRAASA